MGHPYSGVTRTAEGLECYVVVGSFMLFITAIIYLFDFPLSLLADTLILPVDLLTEVQGPWAAATWVGALLAGLCDIAADTSWRPPFVYPGAADGASASPGVKGY